MSLDLTGLETVIQAVIVAAGDLPDGQVVFASQNARAPVPASYMTIKLDGPRTVGGPKGEYSVPAGYDPTQPGAELLMKSTGPAEWTLSLQAYSFLTIDSPAGQQSAVALLADLKAQLGLSIYRNQLNAGGVSIFDFGDVQSIPRVWADATEGRASLDMLFYYRDEGTFRTGYITSVDGFTPSGPPSNGWTPPGGPGGTFT